MDFLGQLARDSDRFGEVLAAVEPDRPVPPCPDWTAFDLLWHLTEVQTFWRTVVERRASAEPEVECPRAASYSDQLLEFRRASSALRRILADTDPATSVWTWSDDHSAAFVRRRQAHEAIIHRADAELTAGLPVSHVDSSMAADGVDEILMINISGIPSWGRFEPDGRVYRIRDNDSEREWTIATGLFSGTSPDTGTIYENLETGAPSNDEPTAELSASANELHLWLWGRGSSETIEGPQPAKEHLRSLARSSTQ